MSTPIRRSSLLLLIIFTAAASASAQSKKPAAKTSAAGPHGAPPQIQVSVDTLMDRRTTRDFPRSELSISFKLEGADASAVQSARARVTKADDDTGKSLLVAAADSKQGSESWQEAHEGGAPTPKVDLASPSRKAKTLATVEGVLEAYMPSRDPASTIQVEKITAKKDKPPIASPALAAQHIRLQVLSKAALEKERADAKAKAQAAQKKSKKGAQDGLEQMGEAMADALTSMLERIFLTAGENDLILKVNDPDKKIFSLGLAAPDGSAIHSYGTMDLDSYRVVRMFEPIPPNASLLVRLKTAKSFGQVPFSLVNLKLP